MPINPNNKDLLLIFDVKIAEEVGKWIEKNLETLEEAIARLSIFKVTKKTGKGSLPYFRLISNIILCSRDPERAGEIALETLIDYREKSQETTEEESIDE